MKFKQPVLLQSLVMSSGLIRMKKVNLLAVLGQVLIKGNLPSIDWVLGNCITWRHGQGLIFKCSERGVMADASTNQGTL
jgi:hypothetical protein